MRRRSIDFSLSVAYYDYANSARYAAPRRLSAFDYASTPRLRFPLIPIAFAFYFIIYATPMLCHR